MWLKSKDSVTSKAGEKYTRPKSLVMVWNRQKSAVSYYDIKHLPRVLSAPLLMWLLCMSATIPTLLEYNFLLECDLGRGAGYCWDSVVWGVLCGGRGAGFCGVLATGVVLSCGCSDSGVIFCGGGVGAGFRGGDWLSGWGWEVLFCGWSALLLSSRRGWGMLVFEESPGQFASGDLEEGVWVSDRHWSCSKKPSGLWLRVRLMVFTITVSCSIWSDSCCTSLDLKLIYRPYLLV